MVSDRLKDFIFKKLYKDLSRVEIIEYKGEIWFIDRKEKFWYFIYTKSNGQMWWRYSFFTPFFLLFSLPSDEFTHILSSWVEEVLNCKVTTTFKVSNIQIYKVEEVLNCKVTTTHYCAGCKIVRVEEVLNCKVTTTPFLLTNQWSRVEDVLNCRVTTTTQMKWDAANRVEEVLNCRVTTTMIDRGIPRHEVEEVLNNNITE